MHVFLTNDDGVGAKGIMALYRAAVARGHEVTMCAPRHQQSAAGHRFTLAEPLFANDYPLEHGKGYAVAGAPADCVRIGLQKIVEKPVDVVLADTTGEMLALMKGADLIVMGKSLAGQSGGHNPIEPALLDKPVVCGAKMTNFRFVQKVLQEADAVVEAESDAALVPLLMPLIANEESRRELGLRAGAAIRCHAGAVRRTIECLETLGTQTR